MKRVFLSVCLVMMFSLAATPSSWAEVIGFEDIVSPGCCTFVPTGYHGFTWSGSSGSSSWVVGQDSANVFSGVEVHSGQNYAWSNGSSDLSISDGFFDLFSFWARAGFGGFTSTAHGFVGATEVFTQNFTVTSNYQKFDFNFLGIDQLTITSNDTNLLIDDICVNDVTCSTSVPEPTSLVLMGLGLFGFVASGLYSRRHSLSRKY
jgi:hypothetical protein